MTNSFAELEDARCIFIIGSNTTVAHPLIATRIYRAKAKGAKLIVADPREIQMARFADIHVRHRLGTDVALLNGMMHVIYKKGWHDRKFIAERTENLEDLVKVIENWPPERACEVTGVAVDDIVQMADYYAHSQASSIVYCMGITQHTTGVDNVKSLANLSMLCGQIGRPSTGVNPLRGQNNVQVPVTWAAFPTSIPPIRRSRYQKTEKNSKRHGKSVSHPTRASPSWK